MRTIYYPPEEDMTFTEFAEHHNLVLVIRKRSRALIAQGLHPFYVSFQNAEIKEGLIRESAHGNGNLVDEAIADYAKRISGKLLVLNATNPTERKEIQVPQELIYET